MTDISETPDHPGSRRKFSQDKWRQILDAAAATFAAKGYEATTIRDIAESVGMLGGSLYYYIDTKEDLLYALIDDFHRQGMEEVAQAEAEAAARGGAQDPLATLRAVCSRHAEVNAASRTLSAVFYNDFRHLSDDRKHHIAESRARHQARIEELLRACQDAGEIRADIDPHLVALAALALLNSTNAWYRPERDTSGQPIGDVLASLLIDGLTPASAKAPSAAPTAKAPVKAPVKTTRRKPVGKPDTVVPITAGRRQPRKKT